MQQSVPSVLQWATDYSKKKFAEDSSLEGGWQYWRVYLGISEYPKDEPRLMQSAYSTFCRTLHGFGNQVELDKKNQLKVASHAILKRQLSQLHKQPPANYREYFDQWHKSTVEQLIAQWRTIYQLNVGQAQKWVNILIKYHLALGDSGLYPKLRKYYHFAIHAPIDNVVYDALLDADDIAFQGDTVANWMYKNRLPAWSRINTYEQYEALQHVFRSIGDSAEIPPISIELFTWLATIEK